jgi:hypothetical protein
MKVEVELAPSLMKELPYTEYTLFRKDGVFLCAKRTDETIEVRIFDSVYDPDDAFWSDRVTISNILEGLGNSLNLWSMISRTYNYVKD